MNDATTNNATTTPLPSTVKETVKITFIEANGTEKIVEAEIGKNLMEIAHEHNVELEGTVIRKK